MKKIKVIRVITSNYCIPAHLSNTLRRIPKEYIMYVIGDDVIKFRSEYPNVNFINLKIQRNPNPIFDLYCLFKLFIYFVRIKPDIVHSIMTKSGLMAMIASKFSGTKVRIHTFTGQVWANKVGVKRTLLKLIDILICNFSTNCLTDSHSQSEYLLQNGVSKNNKKIDVLHKGSLSGVDFNRIVKLTTEEKSKLRNNYNLKETDFVLGYIARKSEEKGCIEMLEIFKSSHREIPNLKLLFVGPDESKGKITEFLQKNTYLKEYIISLDFSFNHFELLNIIQILCLPSKREGFGSIIIDASAIGTISIGYDIVGIKDSIQNSVNGFKVSQNNRDEFIDMIKLIHSQNSLLNEMQNKCIEYARLNFDADLLNNKLYQYYDS